MTTPAVHSTPLLLAAALPARTHAQQPSPHPLPAAAKLVHFPNHRFTLTEEGKELIASISGDTVHAVAFLGSSRSGKSFLGSLIARIAAGGSASSDTEDVFRHAPTFEPITEGIDAAVVPLPNNGRLLLLDLEGGDNALQAQGGAASGGTDEETRHHSAVNLLAMLCGSVVFVSKSFSHRGLQELQATVAAAATRLGLGDNDTQSTLHYVLNSTAYIGNDNPLKKVLAGEGFDILREKFRDITFNQLPQREAARDDFATNMERLAQRAVATALANPVKIQGVALRGPALVQVLEQFAELLKDGDAVPTIDLAQVALRQCVVDPLVADYTRRLPSASAWVSSVGDPIDTVVLELSKKGLPQVLLKRAETMLRQACAPVIQTRRNAIAALGKTVAKVGHQKRIVNRRKEDYVAGYGGRRYGFAGPKDKIWATREIHDTQTRTVTTLYNGTVEYGTALPDLKITNADNWATVD